MSSSPTKYAAEFTENMLKAEKELYSAYKRNSFSSLQLEKKLYFTLFKHLLKDYKDCWLLNVGCGSDLLFFDLQNCGAEIIGIDIVVEPLKEIKSQGAKNVVLADVHYLPFRENSFDLAFTLGVLHHLFLIEKATNEIVRVVKQNRYALFSEPNHLFIFTKIIELLPHRLTFALRSQILPALFNSRIIPASYERTLDPAEVRQAVKGIVSQVYEIFETSPQITLYSMSSAFPKVWDRLVKVLSRQRGFRLFLSYKFITICTK